MVDQPQVGWIGLGKMGVPMVSNLLAAELPVTVYNRTPGHAAGLVANGATQAKTVSQLGRTCEIVVSMIADDGALRAIALGDDGILSHLADGAIYVDMSTVSPAASAEVAKAAASRHIAYVRAPVNGTVIQAEAATLVVLCSGPEDASKACRTMFEVLGSKIHYLGDGEQARAFKLAVNMMVGITAAMWSEAMIFGKAAGLDWEQMIDIIGETAVGSPYTQFRAPALKSWDFTPTFTTRQIAKDLDLALAAANSTGAPTPITSQVRQFYQEMIDDNKGDLDFLSYAKHLDEQVR